MDAIDPDSLDEIFSRDYDMPAAQPIPIVNSPAGSRSPLISPSPCLIRAPTATPKSASTDQLPEVLPADVSSRVSAPINLKLPYNIPDIIDYPSTSHLLIGLPNPAAVLGPMLENERKPDP